ncbi:hypothetical protein JW960_09715 [candidate division KSB1 bacterium]|nr:hypothetical protein [candidate division KSB1 bacterium]
MCPQTTIVTLHPHARMRLTERGATENEVIDTILRGETFSAKFGRTGFRLNFNFDAIWRGKKYGTKQIEAYAVEEQERWIVIIIIVKFF